MGFFIAIDGLDGSGKATQSELLCQYLTEQGKKVRHLSFPSYGTKGCIPVEMYLHGELGQKPEDTNAYAASSLFLIDQFISYQTDWKKDYEEPDTIIVSDRYCTSNAVHQLSKVPRSEWDEFLDWLSIYSFEQLCIPRPNLVLFLAVEPEVSMKLINSRSDETGRTKDIHENLDFLNRSYDSAQYASKFMNWDNVYCSFKGRMRPIYDISEEICLRVEDALKKKR